MIVRKASSPMAGKKIVTIVRLVMTLKALIKVLENRGIIHKVTANTLLDLIETE